MDNQQLYWLIIFVHIFTNGVQRLSQMGVHYKHSGNREVLNSNAEELDIVSTLGKLRAVHKRTVWK
ncbi:hypothetical protein PBI_PBS1_311 [Bacillus phage PBS1]|uniref:Uncharacterized protein n=1 Tax=Bacillus phage PBS1 TaxID=2884423 RepID=A0A223LDV0_BPPB1|nr:hypothetical protein FK780_gp136 [Bacillus phage PBS1]ASU00133.1 hypothetical protein PBI_PBS1_311 [Bacillus phage PBS1]